MLDGRILRYWWLKRSAPFMTHELVMIEQEYMMAKYSHVALSTLRKGRYATMSCRERDIESQTGSQ